MAPRLRSLLDEDEDYEYGTILPAARKKGTGEVSWALPGLVRGPAQGLLGLFDEFVGATEGEGFDPKAVTEGALSLPAAGLLADSAAKPAAKAVIAAANKGKTQAGVNAGLLAEKHADDLEQKPFDWNKALDPDSDEYKELKSQADDIDDDPFDWPDDDAGDEINYPSIAAPYEPPHGMNKSATKEDIPTPWPAPRHWNPWNEERVRDLFSGVYSGKEAETIIADSEYSKRLIKTLWEKDPERMQRAKDMGFDTERVFFHGTPHDDITRFEPQRHGEAYDMPGVKYDASFFASNPITAEGYQYHGQPVTYPKGKEAHITGQKELKQMQDDMNQAYMNASKAKKAGNEAEAKKWMEEYEKLNNAESKKWSEVDKLKVDKDPAPNLIPVLVRRGDTRFTNWEGGTPGDRKISNDITAALSEGRDSAVMKNIFDTPFHHQLAVFDAKRIRSIFAQFRDKESDDLLAANKGKAQAGVSAGLLADRPNTAWPASTRYESQMAERMIDNRTPQKLLKNVWEKDPERMQRAKDMGFDTDRLWYHGSPDISKTEKFDMEKAGSVLDKDTDQNSAFFAATPEPANSFASNYDYSGEGKGVIPVLLKRGETAFEDWNATGATKKMGKQIEKAIRQKKDSVVFKNIHDPSLTHVATTFDPKRIRSIFAQFKDKESDDLLAANPGSLPSLLAEALLARKKNAQ